MEDRAAADIAKALGNPLRIGFLREVRKRERLSPVEFARTTGLPLGNVSYHVRALETAGVLMIVKTVGRRGAVEHYFAVKGPNSAITLAVLDLLADH
jgi:DNA-binding transcriptional ArsR family regulator